MLSLASLSCAALLLTGGPRGSTPRGSTPRPAQLSMCAAQTALERAIHDTIPALPLDPIGVDPTHLSNALLALAPPEEEEQQLLVALLRSSAPGDILAGLAQEPGAGSGPDAEQLAALFAAVEPSYQGDDQQDVRLLQRAAQRLGRMTALLRRCATSLGDIQVAQVSAALALVCCSNEGEELNAEASLPPLLASTVDLMRAKQPAWDLGQLQLVAMDAILTEHLALDADDRGDDDVFSAASVSGFLGWIEGEVEPEDLDDWLQGCTS